MDRRETQQLPPRQLARAATGVMLAMFLSIFSQTIVATAMPRIIADLGGFARYTWPATAYLVATAVAVPIVGRLSDIHGRRVFLILGLVIFTLCSIPAGLSQSMNQLVVSRLLQGIGGGLITASSFAAAADLFPPQGRGRFEAYAGLTSGIAAVTGPLLGGFITDHFGWSWIFLLNVPVGLAVLALLPAFPKIRSEARRPAAGLPRHDDPGARRRLHHGRLVMDRRQRREDHRPRGVRRSHGRRVHVHPVEIRASHHAPGNIPEPHGSGGGDRGAAERFRTLRQPRLHPLVPAGKPQYVRRGQRPRPWPPSWWAWSWAGRCRDN